ncbi:MAG: 2-C-methyl-D-erythritol 2,4-cyclodiphosphate synthase [Pseudomonadota bacterium]|nr:2-C-methyl-D-erythritol 2,4-cyclodiphosphate synthase [Pseudomonadota bacterium]
MKISVIICAAGDGNRLNSANPTPKQYLVVNGKSIIEYSIDKFIELDIIENIVIAINPSHSQYALDIIKKDAYKDKVFIIHGSNTRLKSVMKGLEYLNASETTHVFIHDAARPNFSQSLPNNLIKAAEGHHGSIPIIEASNTIKQFKNEKLNTLDRSSIVESQTPQFFEFMAIYDSYRNLANLTTGVNHVTDDAQVAELAGLKVNTFKDSKKNYKITFHDDLDRFKMESENMSSSRVGIGFDVHKFGEGHNIRIFGIDIPFNKKLVGHSDADVGLHAITDAIYGSIGSDDIGSHFNPADKRWQGADSKIFLDHSLLKLEEFGGKILNIDLVVIAEEPNINSYKNAIKKALSALLKIDESNIGLKATTTEKLGFAGRKEGIAVQTIVNISVKK